MHEFLDEFVAMFREKNVAQLYSYTYGNCSWFYPFENYVFWYKPNGFGVKDFISLPIFRENCMTFILTWSEKALWCLMWYGMVIYFLWVKELIKV